MSRIWWMGLLLIALLAAGFPAERAGAQRRLSPGDSRPEPETPLSQEQRPPLDLPPIPPPPGADAMPSLGAGIRVYVRGFRVEGSTVFGEPDFARVTAPFSERGITSEQLVNVCDAVTQLYVNHGYITSGAVIPDQPVNDGIVRIQITEGRLAEVRVLGTRHFSPAYFRRRLLRAGRAPVNSVRIERQLQRFLTSDLVEHVAATLTPGVVPGESILVVTVEEARNYHLDMATANDHATPIGSTGGEVGASYANLIGYEDVLSASVDLTAGLRDYRFEYTLPINARDTRLSLRYRHSRTHVVDSDLPSALDPKGRWYSADVSLEHPVYRAPSQTLYLGLRAERRATESYVVFDGERLCLVGDTCRTVVNALRFFGNWSWVDADNAVAMHSALSVGLQGLDATRESESTRGDGQFVSWLGQGQWLHVLPSRWWRARILTRLDLQLASEPLLITEQFAVGGSRTVRGYPEYRLVRDNGVVFSTELQLPLLRDKLERTKLELIPFVDAGHAWDEPPKRSLRRGDTLVSVGLGLRLAYRDFLMGEIFWGAPLLNKPEGGDTLQDVGVHFRFHVRVF